MTRKALARRKNAQESPVSKELNSIIASLSEPYDSYLQEKSNLISNTKAVTHILQTACSSAVKGLRPLHSDKSLIQLENNQLTYEWVNTALSKIKQYWTGPKKNIPGCSLKRKEPLPLRELIETSLCGFYQHPEILPSVIKAFENNFKSKPIAETFLKTAKMDSFDKSLPLERRPEQREIIVKAIQDEMNRRETPTPQQRPFKLLGFTLPLGRRSKANDTQEQTGPSLT